MCVQAFVSVASTSPIPKLEGFESKPEPLLLCTCRSKNDLTLVPVVVLIPFLWMEIGQER
jgi:hypothetical protein